MIISYTPAVSLDVRYRYVHGTRSVPTPTLTHMHKLCVHPEQAGATRPTGPRVSNPSIEFANR